tara:strand:+ start:564 stop:929 length:366 start_codon:yes stop_codon:yes gene_type:complete
MPVRKLDPEVVKRLPAMYDNHRLAYEKGVVSGDIKPKYFKASDIPEKKATPEAFKNQHKKRKQKRSGRRPPVFSHDEIVPTIHGGIIRGYSRQEVIQSLVEQFRVSKHSAGYHYDKFVGKR